MKPTQLEDIAQQTGCSKTLISMVLNGKGAKYGISEKTQKMVLDVITQLNYAPHKLQKALNNGKSKLIGFIVSDISNPFYSSLARHIEQCLNESGFQLILCNTHENEEREKHLVSLMLEQFNFDGLIVVSTMTDSGFYDQALFKKAHIVFIDRVLPLSDSNYIVTDNYRGSFDLVKHLIKIDCKHIACFTISPNHLSVIEDRLSGYKDAITQHQSHYSSQYLHEIDVHHISRDIEAALMSLLNSNIGFDAVYALNNQITIALLGKLKDKRFQKLAGLKIATFDDLEIYDLLERSVISVAQPIHEIGKQAGNLMMDLILGKQKNQKKLVLSNKIISR